MTKPTDLTQARLRELLTFDPASGEFRWLPRPITKYQDKSWNARYAGTVAGSSSGTGHRLIGVDGGRYCAHRLAWLWLYGEWPTRDLDHADVTPNNNCIENLRTATPLAERRQRAAALAPLRRHRDLALPTTS
jgi:hypothetical protein